MADSQEQKQTVTAWLTQAFAVQSRLAAKAGLYAQLADKQGDRRLAVFFRASQSAREVHSRRLLMLLRGKIPSDLASALAEFQNEQQEALSTLQQGLATTAGVPGNGWGASFEQFLTVEKRLAALAQRAGEAEKIFVCQVCGHPSPGEPPARCPVCGAIPNKFRDVGEGGEG